MNIEILITIGMMILAGLITYAIGFGVGRRSAYNDIEMNIGRPKKPAYTPKPLFNRSKVRAAKSVLTATVK